MKSTVTILLAALGLGLTYFFLTQASSSRELEPAQALSLPAVSAAEQSDSSEASALHVPQAEATGLRQPAKLSSVAPQVEVLGDAPSQVSAEAAELASVIEKLRQKNLSASETSKQWQKLAKLGMADELIAQLRAELDASPLDADLHAMLGNALVTKMRSEVLSPAERREVSGGAMASFDKALEIDSQNWTARFSRAMSNSSAPAFLGRQSAAIEDFEVLLAQQRESPLSDDQAHTYFFLGNLLESNGNAQRAGEINVEARGLFPNDPRFSGGRE